MVTHTLWYKQVNGYHQNVLWLNDFFFDFIGCIINESRNHMCEVKSIETSNWQVSYLSCRIYFLVSDSCKSIWIKVSIKWLNVNDVDKQTKTIIRTFYIRSCGPIRKNGKHCYRACILSAKDETEGTNPWNKQYLKEAEVKIWRCITKGEMFGRVSRSQA